jgi:hypothetical protein
VVLLIPNKKFIIAIVFSLALNDLLSFFKKLESFPLEKLALRAIQNFRIEGIGVVSEHCLLISNTVDKKCFP